MKKWLLIFAPLLALIIAATAAAEYAKPKIEAWVLANLKSFSEKELPVIIEAQDFHLNFFLPKAELLQLTIKAKPELELGPLEVKIDKLVAKLDLLQILAGRIQLSGVLAEGLSTEINLDPFLERKEKPHQINWTPFFRALKKIPITRLALQGAHATLLSAKEQIKADLIDLDLLIINERERLQIRLDMQDANLIWGELASPMRLQAEALLSPQGLDLNEIRLLGLGSVIKGQASFTKLSHLLLAPEGNANFEIKAALPQVSQLLRKIKSAPLLEGSIEAKGQVSIASGHPIGGGFRFFGSKLKADQFQIGQIETEGRFTADSVRLKKISLTHDAGLVDVSDVELKFLKTNDEISRLELSAAAKTEGLDIHDLLFHLGIGDLPLEILITAETKCQGPLWPELTIGCNATVEADQIEVRTGEGIKNTIVQVPHLGAEGTFQIDAEKISYQAKLTEKQDTGRSSGTIRYQNGFDIDFSTPSLDLDRVKHLAGLQLSGTSAISGKTFGNSDWAKFQMQIAGQNFYFENFYLGQVKTDLKYNSGNLEFKNIEGSVGNSNYLADVSVDLVNETMQVKAKSDRLDLVDVTKMIERRVPLPFSLTGSGVGEIELTGPLQVNHLTYKAKTQFSRVSALGETFDQVLAQVSSNDGEFRVDQAFASKAGHRIDLTGVGHPTGYIEFIVNGKDLPLENSDNVSLLGSHISGKLNFNTKIEGHLFDPNYHLNGKLSEVLVEEQELADSNFDVEVNSNLLKGSADLIGGTLTTKFKFPFKSQENFDLSLKAKEWNFTNLFTLIGAGQLISEYQSSLTGTLDLHSDSGGFWASSGEGLVQKFLLKRGSLHLDNPETIKLHVKHGQFSFENFNLTGSDAQIQVQSTNSTRDALDAKIIANADLRLFQIFLPFLEELSGKLRSTIGIGGALTKPEILGSAETDAAYVKIKGFPHPFEKINSDVQFSQSKILINSIHGDLAGGSFQGDGQISILGLKELPTQVNFQISNVTLDIPEHIRTKGSGVLSLTGSWFPFTLSGEYKVNGGMIDKEFTDDNLQNQIKQSSYLPKMILQKAFEPVLLDLRIHIDQPLPIKNSLIEGAVNGDLAVKGPPANPILLGTVNTEKGTKILFRDKVFEVNSANLKFSDPKELNPELYVSARARVKEFDISLLVQGTAKAPLLRTSSTPPLSEPDIVSLLALGITSADLDKRLQKNTQENAGQYQIGTALLQQFEPVKKLQKATGIQVQYSSTYDNTRNTEVRKFTATKQLNEKTTISVSFPPDKQPDEYRLQYSLTPSVSAIGTFEQKNRTEDRVLQQNEIENVLGLDLEFRREFR